MQRAFEDEHSLLKRLLLGVRDIGVGSDIVGERQISILAATERLLLTLLIVIERETVLEGGEFSVVFQAFDRQLRIHSNYLYS